MRLGKIFNLSYGLLLFCLTLVSSFSLIPQARATTDIPVPEIRFEKFTLPNGLDVILHEDHTTPVVAVNVWYHVGSRNEKPGRTGFAHLFEHMMFQGSENYDEDYFKPLLKIGAKVNGSTTEDRTNYWENVPSDQLELALWLEADRMGFLVPAMTQEKLDNQRDVVKNEKRQRENRPYAMAGQIIKKMLYPPGHPYRTTVIGSMDDLSAASLEDVVEFFQTWYTPNNASLCVAGDFDPAEARALIEKHFGPLAAGKNLSHLKELPLTITEQRRAVAEDNVDLERIDMNWHSPGWYQDGDAQMDLIADILGGGKTSRLYQKLVYQLKIAQNVAARQRSGELGSIFNIVATAATGVTTAELEVAIDGVLTEFLDDGVTKEELERAKIRYQTAFLRRVESVGGFRGKADLLNQFNTYTGDPGYFVQDLQNHLNVTRGEVKQWANNFLGKNQRVVLEMVSSKSMNRKPGSTPDFDRSLMPQSTGEISFMPPEIHSGTLANGIAVHVVEKHGLPLIEVHLNIFSGWSADPSGRSGTAALTAAMLDEGAGGLSALEMADEIAALGARLGSRSFFDGSNVRLNITAPMLAEGLRLMGKMVLEPEFPEKEFQRLRRQYDGRQRQEARRPATVAMKEFQKIIFGPGHPYSQPYTGTGTAEGLSKLEISDLQKFHRQWYHPNNAAFVVVGDVTLAEAVTALDKVFGKWEAQALPALAVPVVKPWRGARILVKNKTGASQSNIAAGYLSIKRQDDDNLGLSVVNSAFGGQFASRINLNLREDKGFTYGVRSNVHSFREAGMFAITVPVETQHTAAAIGELMNEMGALAGERPLVGEELADAKGRLVKQYPQSFSSLRGVAAKLDELVTNGLALDQWQSYAGAIDALTEKDAARLVRRHFRVDDIVFVVVGDWEKIADELRELNIGKVELLAD